MLLIAFLAACGPDELDIDGGPTWHEDVAPLVTESCAGCHRTGGIAPFALDTYEAAAGMALAAADAVEEGRMPPFDARESEDCVPEHGLVGDPRWSAEDKQLLRDWADAGAPEGDPSRAAPLPDPTGPGLQDVDAELIPDEGYVTSGDEDEFICVALDVGNREDRWVTGVDVLPGNPLVNHHAVVVTDPYRETESWGDDYVDCFESVGVTDSQVLMVWTPGSDPVSLPESTGIALPANSRVIVQFHYHPTGPAADPDRSTIRLRWQEETPAHQAVFAGIGNLDSREAGLLHGPNDRAGRVEFRIPEGIAGHTETMELDLDGSPEFRIFSVMPHMHYIGTGMTLRWKHGDTVLRPAWDECLIESGWDFAWQRTYTYDAPVAELPISRGDDTAWLQCSYDNTMDNPWVVQALEDAGLDAPIPVELGEGTLDEMCIGILGIVI